MSGQDLLERNQTDGMLINQSDTSFPPEEIKNYYEEEKQSLGQPNKEESKEDSNSNEGEESKLDEKESSISDYSDLTDESSEEESKRKFGPQLCEELLNDEDRFE